MFAKDQIMIGFRPTGYSDYQNGSGFETATSTACENPYHNFDLKWNKCTGI